ncbi:MAG: SDR family oxidoreductase [Firmicutes bacterium]|nr:SDR family oxidoreductase [Alicyclobacillaceae bacterium]MCL6498177.1 SDR family oxidoreductase [Bacillota bacterium]
MDLAGRVALVTGAAKPRAIGNLVALGLAREGADLVVADLYEEGFPALAEAVGAMGRRSLGLRVDVLDAQAVEAMVEQAIAEFGHIDILVNAVGGSWSIRPEDIRDGTPPDRPVAAATCSDAEWHQIIGVNLHATFYVCRAVARHMMAARRGRIVNFSSMAGRRGGQPGSVISSGPYAVAKAGVIGLTKQLALELAPYGITVNAVAPGIIESWRGERALASVSADARERIRAAIPMGRVGAPEEVANMVVALCSGELQYVTGAVVDINGGMWSA